jgi:plastocyanin
MGYLATVNVDGTSYRLLDVEHDIGPGGFALSPDGQVIAYGGGNTGWLYRWGAGPEPFDPEPYGLIGTKGAQIGSPAWSPDGTRLAWVVSGGFATDGNHRIGIGVFDLEARTATLIHPYVPVGRGGWPPAPAWSPNGRWLALETWSHDPDEAGVWVVQVDGLGTEEHYLGSGSHPVWSPDGGQMAFYRIPQGGDPGIWVVESSMRELYPLGLPPDAVLVDWITASTVLTSPAVPSIEPTATEMVVLPQIASFQVQPTEVSPGDVVTLTWEASGHQATICPSARFALFTSKDCWQVPLSGMTMFAIPLKTGGNRSVDLLLTVEAEGSAAPAMWHSSVAFKCQTTWFFSDAPQAGICPLDPIKSYAAVQHFEHGTMIWIEQLGRYVILVEAPLHDDGTQAQVAYVQDPLETVRDTSVDITAPNGFHAPTSGFGLVWRGDVTGSPGYRETLGWALAPEFGYDTILQCDDALPSGGRSWQTCYLQGPDGEIIVLDPLDRWYLWNVW